MAEFMNRPASTAMGFFNVMGKPIPPAARQAAYEACKAMGLDQARSWEAVNTTAEQLERDKPYEALGAATKLLDLTGAYRLMATLLAHASEPGADHA